MPKYIGTDQTNDFRGILAGAGVKEALKKAISSGQIFQGRPSQNAKIPITIPMPNFTWNGTQYAQDQPQPKPKKPKIYRSIEDPFEPAW